MYQVVEGVTRKCELHQLKQYQHQEEPDDHIHMMQLLQLRLVIVISQSEADRLFDRWMKNTLTREEELHWAFKEQEHRLMRDHE